MISENPLILTDSYKVSHHVQYPPKTTKVYSYFESRGGEYEETCFFGLQYFLKRYLQGARVTHDLIDDAEAFFLQHFGRADLFNRAGWAHMVDKHGGTFPVSIRAVLEGTVVPTRNVLMTVENTCPDCFWVTNYLETLLVQVWYPTTVATLSRSIKALIGDYLEKTGDPAGLPFKLHDFGFRGVSSVESAGIGGAAHLVNFMGTDTMQALAVARDYYRCPMAGFSIPAAEHSTITAWGREREGDAFANMVERFGGGPLYAVVSDSYDIHAAVRDLWGGRLREKVLGAKGTLVVRPDSGDPAETVLGVVSALGHAFGSEVNSKGYKVLNPKVRVIQGDGVDPASIGEILGTLMDAGWSADNVAFGMGGALLQKLNRDTCRFAFKCSYVEAGGEGIDVFKQPVGDPGKNSKRGRLKLVKEPQGGFRTIPAGHAEFQDELVEVYRDGELLRDQKFDEIRQRAGLGH